MKRFTISGICVLLLSLSIQVQTVNTYQDTLQEVLALDIFDMQGRKRMSIVGDQDWNRPIAIGHLNPGMYNMVLRTTAGIQSTKIFLGL